ncbi:MAG: redoxin domain-containing protein [Bacteroidia bacterium]|nr:redoxin domain-containing protein [Bacteroidia bacterium]
MRNIAIISLLSLTLISLSCDKLGKGRSAKMETLQDSMAYLVGTDYSKGLKEYGFEVNPEAFKAGYEAVLAEKDLAISDEEMARLFAEFQQELQVKAQEQQRKTNVTDGQAAPDLSMATPDGGTMSISDLKGKYVLVDFWAAWCKPCRQENPNVVRLYNQYKDKGFEILGVSLDDNRDAWLQAIEQDGLTWKHMSDLKKWGSESVSVYGFQGIPYTVLIDPDGNIVAQHLRSAELAAQLQSIFGS